MREIDSRSWILDQGWSGEGLENGKLKRRDEHATERSAVECEDRSGGFPFSPRRGAGSCCFGFWGLRLIDMRWSEVREILVRPPVVVALEPFMKTPP